MTRNVTAVLLVIYTIEGFTIFEYRIYGALVCFVLGFVLLIVLSLLVAVHYRLTGRTID